MNAMELLTTRRTYRRFAQKPVPQDVVDDIVQAVRLSSCGANRQAVRLVLVQSPEMVAKVQPLVKWLAICRRSRHTQSGRAAHLLCSCGAGYRHPRRPCHRHRHRTGKHDPCRMGQRRGQLHHGRDQQACPHRTAGH